MPMSRTACWPAGLPHWPIRPPVPGQAVTSRAGPGGKRARAAEDFATARAGMADDREAVAAHGNKLIPFLAPPPEARRLL
jgi:hypothetical protein